jgi:hypothetical protein
LNANGGVGERASEQAPSTRAQASPHRRLMKTRADGRRATETRTDT